MSNNCFTQFAASVCHTRLTHPLLTRWEYNDADNGWAQSYFPKCVYRHRADLLHHMCTVQGLWSLCNGPDYWLQHFVTNSRCNRSIISLLIIDLQPYSELCHFRLFCHNKKYWTNYYHCKLLITINALHITITDWNEKLRTSVTDKWCQPSYGIVT